MVIEMKSDPSFSTAGLINRVPRVTVDFWLIKLLAVTMGETAADYLAVNLGLGLTTTSAIMTVVLIAALINQFIRQQYVPWSYWIAVVLISVVGTLLTDNLSDNLGVPLEASTIGFSILLALTFFIWWSYERTLSIHSIFTTRREAFYWLAILFTFALGTAVGDLISEKFDFGYITTGLIFASVIALIAIAYFSFSMNGILAFWLAYIFTRPLGASLGDYLSQPSEYGGLGFGTVYTSLLFLGAIIITVVYMTAHYEPEMSSDAEHRDL
ncbi:putative membrane-anchored protein [Rhizobium sp. BK376]|nr:putative membrane-anchored protein [Rhizobium sp. BK376]